MKRFVPAALVLIALVLTAVARAEDNKDSATGTWVWKDKGRNGQEIERKLKLKQEGDKLTGAVIGRNNMETEIEDGRVKDGEISFKVTRETNNGKIVMTYTAKVNGDEIKGKIETDRNGRTRERDWEAKRVKDDDKKD